MNFEFAILDFIQKFFCCPFLDMAIPKISALGNGGLVWIIFTIVLLTMKSTRKYGLYMSLSLIIMLAVCNITLKPIVARMRPFTQNSSVTLLIDEPNDYSFPSGHTMAAFAAATAFFMCYLSRKDEEKKTFCDSKILVIFMFAFAFVIAFTRLYLYVHYPSDVFAALVLGVIDGILSAKIIEKLIQSKKLKL